LKKQNFTLASSKEKGPCDLGWCKRENSEGRPFRFVVSASQAAQWQPELPACTASHPHRCSSWQSPDIHELPFDEHG